MFQFNLIWLKANAVIAALISFISVNRNLTKKEHEHITSTDVFDWIHEWTWIFSNPQPAVRRLHYALQINTFFFKLINYLITNG